MRFVSGQVEAKWISKCINYRMNFRAYSTSGTSDRLLALHPKCPLSASVESGCGRISNWGSGLEDHAKGHLNELPIIAFNMIRLSTAGRPPCGFRSGGYKS